jgi:hypothetical protein
MFGIKADARGVQRGLNDIARRQMPFATARALTSTAKLAQQNVARQLPSIFDRPTPFTRNAIGIQAATKTNLVARVFVKARQAEYLVLEETGGTRTPKGRGLVLPRAAPRNQYGNLARTALQTLKRRKDVFIGKGPNGQGGIWRRGKDDVLQPLIIFVGRSQYKPIFDFRKRVIKVAGAYLAVELRDALARAIASTRPRG